MKKTISNILFNVTKINRTHLQLLWVLLALSMMVLGAGAPEDVGGIGIR
ncbi:MAG TPA: hypothetical protein PK152_18305 [Anaerolineales bacterium]|jgi:hypothetical protein|nr:hypothetical protein [Anaerolineales bacterium]HRK91084.1 hypothetical protein [Anaerolineales bacterium]